VKPTTGPASGRSQSPPLNKGLALLKSGNSEVFFFLAMTHQSVGHEDQAHKWYDKGIA
jgi:hypothetical protein